MAQSSNSYQDWLAAYRERLQHDLASFRGLESRWSWIRLIAFAAGFAAVILLRHNLPLAAGAGIAGALVFAGAVLRHVKWLDRRAFTERALIVAAESLHASTRRDSPARAWQRPEDAVETGPGLPIGHRPRPGLAADRPGAGRPRSVRAARRRLRPVEPHLDIARAPADCATSWIRQASRPNTSAGGRTPSDGYRSTMKSVWESWPPSCCSAAMTSTSTGSFRLLHQTEHPPRSMLSGASGCGPSPAA